LPIHVAFRPIGRNNHGAGKSFDLPNMTDLGLTDDELAFYDAQEVKDSAVATLPSVANSGSTGMANTKLAGRNGEKLRAVQRPTSPPAGSNC
jgi:hypothetical protein